MQVNISSILFKLSSLSLKTKIIVAVLLLFLGSIWALTFFSSKRLEQDMTAQIEAQQFSTASYIADSIEVQVKLRLEALAAVASLITPELISNPSKLRIFLSQRATFKVLFDSGAVVISKDGKGIADYPMLPGRSKASFKELEYFKYVIATRRPAIGKPQIGRFSHKPLIAFAAPIFNHSGQLMGVLTNSVSLYDPLLLGAIATSYYPAFRDWLIVVSTKHRLIITGSDPTRNMTSTPTPGTNQTFDKFMVGFEGSGISKNSRGIKMLLTAKHIPTPGWFVRVGLPTEIVFAPIKRMKIWAYSLAFGLSMLSSLLLWFVIRQTFKPLYVASKMIHDITDKRLPIQRIPVNRDDEIGQLLTSFNKHLDYRKQGEDETHELLLMLEAVPNGILVHDTEGNFLYANQRVFDLHGYSRDEFMSLDLHRISAPASEKQIDQRIHELLDYGETSFEVEEIRKDGTSLPLWINVKKATWGGKNVLLSVQTDITERKKVEEALAESKAFLTSIVDSTSDLIWSFDPLSFRLLSFNRAYSEHFLKTRGLEVKIGLLPEDLLPADYATLWREWYHKALQEGPYTMEYVTHDGSRILEMSFNILKRDGVLFAISVFGKDITEHKLAEEERIALLDRLNRSEKMEALGALAGKVAHDLNNVLGVLSGYSELLMESLPEGNALRKYAVNILKSSERGATIIQDLLTLARRGVTVSDVVDLNRIVSNLLVTPEFDRLKEYHPHVDIKTSLEHDLLNVKGSPVHLEKTLMNLVSNAAEAISRSGTVNIRTENRYLDKAVRGYDQVEEGDYVVLTVSDTGEGIAAADLDKIFEPFYTKKSMGRSGTGLGLAIVWGTVKDHEGYIDVQSIEGKGTTFTLYFPMTREAIGEEGKMIPVENYVGHGESILVVDDVESQRQVATDLLMQLGYKVNAVSSGEEALEYLKSNKADILVLDMIMDPGIDGLETYKRVLKINPHQKAIIVSGFSETDQVKEAQRLGAGLYVKKPYVMGKIGVAIRDELARK